MNKRLVEAHLQALTRRTGFEVFRRMAEHKPLPASGTWWHERMLRALEHDEQLKLQAFRFMAALPALEGSPPRVIHHLHEYFIAALPEGQPDPLAELSHRPTRTLRQLVAGATRLAGRSGLAARLLAAISLSAARTMARRFIAGTTIDEAVAAIRRLRKRRLAFTLDVLGEAALSPREADGYARTYQDLITQLPPHAARWPVVPQIDTADGVELPRVNVSVKLTSLHPGLDPIDPDRSIAVACDRLRPLLREAVRHGVHLHIDMEHYAIKDLTLAICQRLFDEPEFRGYPHVGIVLQAYLTDAEDDARRVIEWAQRRDAPLWVRLVKGAYWDSEVLEARRHGWRCPVWRYKWQSDACYERITRLLLAHHDRVHVAFGSHNVRSLSHAMALRELWEIPPDHFELQMLYGMGEPIKAALVEMGQRVRVYTPYGELMPGMAYLIRRLLENTANEGFLRHAAEPGVPLDALLADPVARDAANKRRAVRGPVGTDRAAQTAEGGCAPSGPPPEPVALSYDPLEPPPVPPRVSPLNFVEPQAREGLAAALAKLGNAAPLCCRLHDSGETRHWFERRNPSDPQHLVARIALPQPRDPDAATAAARQAAAAWQRVDVAGRCDALRTIAQGLLDQRYELTARVIASVGKPWRDADEELAAAAGALLAAADGDRPAGGPAVEPDDAAGVVTATTMPEAPLWTAAVATAGSLAAGRAVVLRPPATTADVVWVFAQLVQQAGVPAGVVTWLPDARVVRPEPTLQGGPSPGRPGPATLPRQAANVAIIDDDADLDACVRAVVRDALRFAGQHVGSLDACLVVADVWERFVRRLCDAIEPIRPASAMQPATLIGPLLDAAAFARFNAFVTAARTAGRVLLDAPDEANPPEGPFFAGPKVVADLPAEADWDVHVAGPLLRLARVPDFESALDRLERIAGLRLAGIWSRSPSHIMATREACGETFGGANRELCRLSQRLFLSDDGQVRGEASHSAACCRDARDVGLDARGPRVSDRRHQPAR